MPEQAEKSRLLLTEVKIGQFFQGALIWEGESGTVTEGTTRKYFLKMAEIM